MKSLFVAWQQPNSREWIPVARLDQDKDVYRFSYTKGVTRARGFEPFGKMTEIDAVYESKTLFPLFSNRLISRSRPEYKDYLRWLDLDDLPDDPMTILGLTGGIRGTDSIELFPLPSVSEDNDYRVDFFVRGLSYLPKETIDRIHQLEKNDLLFLMQDCQNKFDFTALAIRTADPISFIGYCPKYYVKDLKASLVEKLDHLTVHVRKVNEDAPLNMRLLCTVEGKLPPAYIPFCDNDDFQTSVGSPLIDWGSISLSVTD